MKHRIIELDILKGLAILLVVIGHIADPNLENIIVGNELYFTIKKFIYSFHMPFFMFISGMIFIYTYQQISTIKEYFKFFISKVERLLLPFFIMGGIIIVGKYIASFIFHINNFNGSISINDFITILMSPMESYSRSLWFIYVLFEYYIIVSLLLHVVQKKIVILIIAIILLFTETTTLFAINMFTQYFLFFILGIICMENYKKYKLFILKYGQYFLILFILMFNIRDFFELKYALLVYGLLSIPSLYYLVLKTPLLHSSFLLLLGKYTFVIYLFNLICIGITLGLLLKFIPLNGIYFTLLLPFIVTIGIFTPISLKKYILNHIPYLKKLTK